MMRERSANSRANKDRERNGMFAKYGGSESCVVAIAVIQGECAIASCRIAIGEQLRKIGQGDHLVSC